MRKNRNVPLLCVISGLQGMVFYTAVATLYRQAAGLNVFQITALEGISTALSLALEVPWGRLADRMGYRRTMIVCNGLFFLSKVIFWRAQGFAAFLAERLLLAVVIAGLSGVDASMLYLSDVPEAAQRNHGWCQAAGQAGLLGAGALYAAFLSGRYRDAALWTMVTYGLAAALTFFLREVRAAEKAPRPRGAWRAAIRRQFRIPGMLPLVLCGALFGEVIHCVTVYFNQLQYVRAGLGERAIGGAFVAASLAGLLGPLSARLTEKCGARRLGMGLLVGSALCLGGLALTRSGALSVGLIVALCAASALFLPLAAALEDHRIDSPDRATAMSVNAMVADSVILLLDLLLGRAADASLPGAMALGAVCCLAAAGGFQVTMNNE